MQKLPLWRILFLIGLTGLTHPLPLGAEPQESLHQAVRFTPEIGTPSLEGPLADKLGQVFFCNARADLPPLDGNKPSPLPQGGTVAKADARGQVTLVTRLPPGHRGNGLQWSKEGELLVADQEGGTVLQVDPNTGKTRTYFTFPPGSGSPNDLSIRKDGTLYVSFFDQGLWMVAPGGTSGTRLAEGFHNGIDLSPDEKRLYSEKWTYDVAEDGTLLHPRPLLQVPKNEDGFSFTDGIRTDARGNIFMARFGGKENIHDPNSRRRNGVIHQFARDGRLIRNIPVPSPDVTNLTFGGIDGRTVFVTHPGKNGFLSSFRVQYPGRGW